MTQLEMPQFKQVITDEIAVSDSASKKLAELLETKKDEYRAIRLFVTGSGCSGMSYGMTLADEKTAFDKVYKDDNIMIYIDSIAVDYLNGVEIDIKESASGSSFVFNNAFSTVGGSGSCQGCSSSGCG
jgi:iron-sulfur cluster insertion protein